MYKAPSSGGAGALKGSTHCLLDMLETGAPWYIAGALRSRERGTLQSSVWDTLSVSYVEGVAASGKTQGRVREVALDEDG